MKRTLLAFAVAACAAISASNAYAAEKLTVMLEWFVNPDHAPLVVAMVPNATAVPKRLPKASPARISPRVTSV